MNQNTIRACSIWRALEIVGDVPVVLIMEQAFLGKHKFEEFVSGTGVARSVISNRLAKLVQAGVFAKLPEKRAGYALTEKGRELFPPALMVVRWQSLWEPGARSIVLELHHKDCGHKMTPLAVCRHCGEEIKPWEVDWADGPGASNSEPATYMRRRMQSSLASAERASRMMVDSVISLIGDRWATLVIRACFSGIHRFDDIQRDIGMATNILADRLEGLQKQGIVKAVPYSAHQDRFDYKLTEKGRDLYPVLVAFLHWGDRWYMTEMGPPLLLTHRLCGKALQLKPSCSECREEVHIRNTAFAF